MTDPCRDCGTTDQLDTDRRCPYCAELWHMDCTLKPRTKPGQTAIRTSSGYYLAADLTRNRYYHVLADDTWVWTPGDGTWREVDLTSESITTR